MNIKKAKCTLVYQIGRKLLDYYRKHKTYNLSKSNRRKKNATLGKNDDF